MSKSKKKKILEYHFLVPIFNQEIKIIVASNKNLQTFLDNKNVAFDKIEDADAACFSMDQYLCIWFEPNTKIDIIVHESAHATFTLMRSRGVNIEDEEMFCYLQEFIINRILKCLKLTSLTVTDLINQK